jgi:hypothetical protein
MRHITRSEEKIPMGSTISSIPDDQYESHLIKGLRREADKHIELWQEQTRIAEVYQHIKKTEQRTYNRKLRYNMRRSRDLSEYTMEPHTPEKEDYWSSHQCHMVDEVETPSFMHRLIRSATPSTTPPASAPRSPTTSTASTGRTLGASLCKAPCPCPTPTPSTATVAAKTTP